MSERDVAELVRQAASALLYDLGKDEAAAAARHREALAVQERIASALERVAAALEGGER